MQQGSTYDSDGEPLIPLQTRIQSLPDIDSEATQRFTATGQPIPVASFSALDSWGGDMFSVPKLLPKQYTDESIIPAIVTNVIPKPKVQSPEGEGKRRKSFVKMFKGEREKDDGKGITKVVFMPRKEYTKYFAKDNAGNYIGSEPARQWTEEELEEKFGEFKPDLKSKGKGETLSFISSGTKASQR